MSSLAADVNSNTQLWDGSSISLDSMIRMSITNWDDNQTIYDMTVLDNRRYDRADGSINHIIKTRLVDGSVELSFDVSFKNGTLQGNGWPHVDLLNYPNMLRSGKSYRIMSIAGQEVKMAQYMKINDELFRRTLRQAGVDGELSDGDSYRAHFPPQLPGEHNAQNLRF